MPPPQRAKEVQHEVRWAETDSSRRPQMLSLGAALADEGTDADHRPKFTGRFNRASEYVGGSAQQFEEGVRSGPGGDRIRRSKV